MGADHEETAARMRANFPAFATLRSIRPVRLIRAMAWLPFAEEWEAFARSLLTKGALPPRTRELVILRVGWNLRNEYVWGGHWFIAQDCGLRLSTEGSGHWDEADVLVLSAVDELMARGRLAAATRTRLAHRWKRAQLLELTIVVGAYQLVCMVVELLRLRPERGSAPLPVSWPADRGSQGEQGRQRPAA